MSDSVTSWTIACQSLLCSIPGKNTGVGCHFLTQGSNPYLLKGKVDSLSLSHQGSPYMSILHSFNDRKIFHYMNTHILLTQLSVQGQLDCFYFLVILNSAAMYICVQVSFAVQKLLSLIRSLLFTFVFISGTLGGGPQRILLWFISSSVPPVVSSKSFIVSGLIFRCLIHFEFIFVYGVAVQFSQHYLLKRLSFLYCI